MEIEIPDECPVCKKVSKNLLLHVNKSEKCSSVIDSELLKNWREAAHKMKSRKAQSKYIKKGKHNEVQAKYAKKCKEEDKESFLQVHRHKNARLRERKYRYKDYKRKYMRKKYRYKRKESFQKLCIRTLNYLRRGECPPETWLNKFHIVEHEKCSKYVDKDGKEFDPDKLHEWLKEIDIRLLILMISFQKIALVPRSYWLKAQKEVENAKKDHLKERLYKLIGKLQAYKHMNTKDVVIPDGYRSICKATEDNLPIWDSMPDVLSSEDETLLVNLLEDIVTHDDINDQEMEDLLKISHHMDVLDVASLYAKL